MKIVVQTDKVKWDNWLTQNSDCSCFSQSWAWGDILMVKGTQVDRLMVVDNDEVLLQAQVVYNNLPLGMKYVFWPKGPIFSQKLKVDLSADSQEVYKVMEVLFDYFKKQDWIFLRLEPSEIINNLEFKLEKIKDVNPSATLILDLTKSAEELLADMHPKTRYNINLAQRKGVLIKSEKNLAEFLKLMKKTGERDRFRLHGDKHYQEILNSDISLQFNAYFGDKIIATAVFVKFGDTFTYLYGASDYEFRNLMAPNLLQWEGIKFAKSLGYKYYDFFGIAPIGMTDNVLSLRGGTTKQSHHPVPICHSELAEGSKQAKFDNKNFIYDQHHQYAGVTRFKLGFGGDYKKDLGTFDLIINKPKYFCYTLLRKLRRMF